MQQVEPEKAHRHRFQILSCLCVLTGWKGDACILAECALLPLATTIETLKIEEKAVPSPPTSVKDMVKGDE